MRVTLDLGRLVADGRLSCEEAARLTALGEASPPPQGRADRRRVLANVMMIFGALAVAVAVAMLHPTAAAGGALSVVALVGGGLLLRRDDESWTLLAQALAIGGALGASLALLEAFPRVAAVLLAIGLFLSVVAFYFRNSVVAAFAPLALGSWLGSGAGYWHAVYEVTITQPLVTVVVFTAFAAGLFRLRETLPRQERVLTAMARVSFVLANMGFWVGSLWGDDFGADTLTRPASSGALIIPAAAFTWAWVAALAAFLVLGLRIRNRFVSNAALTFMGIHFYTQVFESFGAKPAVVIVCGLLLVAAAFLFLRFDRWQRSREQGAGDAVQSST